MQYRHEYKHYLNYADYLAIRGRLMAVCRLDSHVSERGSYTIRSLYFDNAADIALNEKISGLSEREKFRIRVYDSNYDFIRLEKKVKRGGLGYKVSAPLTKEETRRIIDGDIDWMAESRHAPVIEMYEKMKTRGLRPKTIVEYTREPYVYDAGNVRITLDYNIRTGVYSRELLNPDIPTLAADSGTIILEVKYDNFLPDVIRDIIQLRFREESAFSKYEACRIYG